jgi:hypothetical protein
MSARQVKGKVSDAEAKLLSELRQRHFSSQRRHAHRSISTIHHSSPPISHPHSDFHSTTMQEWHRRCLVTAILLTSSFLSYTLSPTREPGEPKKKTPWRLRTRRRRNPDDAYPDYGTPTDFARTALRTRRRYRERDEFFTDIWARAGWRCGK